MLPDVKQQSNSAYANLWEKTKRERSKTTGVSTRVKIPHVYSRISEHEKQQRELFRILPTEVIQQIIKQYGKTT